MVAIVQCSYCHSFVVTFAVDADYLLLQMAALPMGLADEREVAS